MSDDLNFSEMLRDSADSAESFLWKAITAINSRLGEGYAEQHPELISAFMMAAAIEDAGLMIANTLKPCINNSRPLE
ncbi:MAG: hypothetical protein Q7U57_09640 [Methylovulum sp.]|nr:hypothetical protein [Methylovulum sp.]